MTKLPPVGSIVEGVVKKITKFGAFVELPGGLTGLVHISEIAPTYVRDVQDYLQENDRVKVKVINIDEQGRIGLSIKKASVSQVEPTASSFEEKLARFLKESGEKLQELKQSPEAKRKKK